jgi:HSP20 family protein
MSEKEALTTRAMTPLRNLRREVDRLFGDVFSSFGEEVDLPTKVWAPRMDMSETEKEFVIRADLPGINKGDVRVEVEDNELTIRGERKEMKREESENFLRVERSFGSFYRSITLPKAAKTDEVAAEFKNGELIVRVPKAEETARRNVKIS